MLKRIPTEDLRAGMHVHELCGAWIDHPFWREDFVLRDPGDIRLILDSGITEVVIDSAQGLDVADAQGVHTPDAAVVATSVAERMHGPPRHVPMAEELVYAAKICARAKTAVESMFHEVRMGKAVDASATDLVEDISSSVLRNPGALISLARLKSADDYTYMHSVAVCALMVSLGHQLGLDEDATREAGMAGLLHDLGKALTPHDILNKPGKLTAAEFAVMKRHPEEGHRLLVEGKSVGGVALDVCLHHHEKIDGSGYPVSLKEGAISLAVKMSTVCDVYDAITSNRPYKAGWDPAESIRMMTTWRPHHFDEHVFQAFVKSVGIYPVGSLLRLSSGRLAVVTEQAGKSLVTPIVKVFFSTKSQSYIPPEIVDLSRPGCPEKIAGREDAAKWGIKELDRYWAHLQ